MRSWGVGGDFIANKKTYLLIKAIEKANPKQRKTLTNWIGVKGASKKEKVKTITGLYDALDLHTITQRKADAYFSKAFKQLEKVNGLPTQKDALLSFSKELIARQH